MGKFLVIFRNEADAADFYPSKSDDGMYRNIYDLRLYGVFDVIYDFLIKFEMSKSYLIQEYYITANSMGEAKLVFAILYPEAIIKDIVVMSEVIYEDNDYADDE